MEYYWCLKHERVEQEGCANKDRLGPYPTRAAAESALVRAAERTEDWDAADLVWEEAGYSGNRTRKH